MATRTLRLSSPNMHGGDVSRYQRDLNGWLERWNVPHRIDVDGEYGIGTRAAHKLVCHGLGVNWRDGATPTVRRKVHDADRRTDREKKIGGERADWRHRLKDRYASPDGGPKAAVAYAEKFIGVKEHPPGSNVGPHITEWERLTGYNVPSGGPGVPWCGCFANACLIAAGLPNEHFMGYCPYIEAHARSGSDGWTWHSANEKPERGWLALFGQPIAAHVELVTHTGFPLRTIGGNTSAGNGSPNNGGAVVRHDFSSYRGMPLRGFAAPKYA